MQKRSILNSIAVAAVFLSASPAAAGVPAYHTRYYSDSSHQNQVGGRFWTGCRVGPAGDEAIYQNVGTQTAYSTTELAGYCQDGEMFDA